MAIIAPFKYQYSVTLPEYPDSELLDYSGIAADLYDALRGDDPLPGEFFYYLRELRRTEGPHLEIGCGTGRILLRLIQAGLDVEGLDTSRDMLTKCEAKAAALRLSPLLHRQPMQQMSLATRYGVIFVPLASMMLLPDALQFATSLDAFRRHLRPDGRLAFSIYRRPFLMLDSPWSVVGEVAFEGHQVRVSQATSVEPAADTITERFRFELMEDGRVLGTHAIRLRFWEVEQIRAMLIATGFDRISVMVGHDDGPAAGQSSALVFSALCAN